MNIGIQNLTTIWLYQKFDFRISYLMAFFSSGKFYSTISLSTAFTVCVFPLLNSYFTYDNDLLNLFFRSQTLLLWNPTLFALFPERNLNLSISLSPFSKNLLWNILDIQRSVRYHLTNTYVSTPQLKKNCYLQNRIPVFPS